MKPINLLKDLALEKLKHKYPSVPGFAIPIPKYSDKTSNGLTKCVIDFITFNGFQAERINSTGRRIDKTKVVTDTLGRKRQIGSVQWIKGTTQVGTADISVTIKGRSVKIEVKCKATNDNKQSIGQIEYQKTIESAGGEYFIARTFDGFYEWYIEFINKY